MRTVVMFGSLIIADAISAITGHQMPGITITFGSIVLCGAIILDLIYVFKK